MKPSEHSAAALLAVKRWVYFIPIDSFVPKKGYRVSVVIEGEHGHFPTGNATEDPWYWGMTYVEAEAKAAEANDEIGHTAKAVWEIVGPAMFPAGSRAVMR